MILLRCTPSLKRFSLLYFANLNFKTRMLDLAINLHRERPSGGRFAPFKQERERLQRVLHRKLWLPDELADSEMCSILNENGFGATRIMQRLTGVPEYCPLERSWTNSAQPAAYFRQQKRARPHVWLRTWCQAEGLRKKFWTGKTLEWVVARCSVIAIFDWRSGRWPKGINVLLAGD